MITLQLQPEIEAKLLSQASARGLELNQYLTTLVKDIDEEDQGFMAGSADIAAGRTRPAEEVFTELHERYGIQG